jgi:predicted methyltransferase
MLTTIDKFVTFQVDIDAALIDLKRQMESSQHVERNLSTRVYEIENMRKEKWEKIFWDKIRNDIHTLRRQRRYNELIRVLRVCMYKGNGRTDNIEDIHQHLGIYSSLSGYDP